ncbi:MAG TPA: sodium:solute symporter family protein [Acidobacteriaceae bacterium]|nr:sodium:solute symporter family protein [Acidobacteriaceae bacterium]
MALYAATLAAIVIVLLAVSLTRLGKVRTRADYLVAGRSLPAFVLVFTLLCSWIGSGSLLAAAENGYRHGFAALWTAAGGWAGLALIYFIAPRARRFAQFTIPDLLEARYNQAARILGVIAILFTYTAITSYQFIGGGDILHLVFPSALSPIQGRILIAAFVILFTAIAGMSSVAYMDVAIGLLATVTLCVALPVLVHSCTFAGFTGWAAVHAALPASHFKVFGDIHPFTSYVNSTPLPDGTHEVVSSAFALFLPTMLLMLGNQSMYQKFFSAKSERDATRAVGGWIVGTVLLETVIVALAVAGSAVYPTGEVANQPREVLAYAGLHQLQPLPATTNNTVILSEPRSGESKDPDAAHSAAVDRTVLPPNQPSSRAEAQSAGVEGPPHLFVQQQTTQRTDPTYLLQFLGALLVGSIFAKIISTANNYLFSPATNMVNDIFVRYLRPGASNRQVLLVSRLMVVALGIWALYQGLHTESVLKKALYAYTIYSAALTPVILAAFYWKRATASAAVACIFTGTFVTAFWDTPFIHAHFPPAIANQDAILPALLASLACLILVSFVTNPPSESHLASLTH